MRKKVRKLKLYLDTSVISALFDKRSPEIMQWTHGFWKFINKFDAFISDVVVAEIQGTPDTRLKKNMLTAIKKMHILEIDDEAERLSNEYVRYGAVPQRYRTDAYHIGIATVNQTNFLISWNFKHIVRRRTREIVRMVNALYGYQSLEIMSPPEVLWSEEE